MVDCNISRLGKPFSNPQKLAITIIICTIVIIAKIKKNGIEVVCRGYYYLSNRDGEVVQTAIERSIPAMRKTETRLDAMLYSSGFTELMMVVVFKEYFSFHLVFPSDLCLV